MVRIMIRIGLQFFAHTKGGGSTTNVAAIVLFVGACISFNSTPGSI